MKERKTRPVNLDLQTIHFPITAIASILHRVSGVITFVAIGILLWLLSISLSSPVGFMEASDIVDGFFVKFILWGILTALAYHIAGGIRHLSLWTYGTLGKSWNLALTAARRLHWQLRRYVASVLAGDVEYGFKSTFLLLVVTACMIMYSITCHGHSL